MLRLRRRQVSSVVAVRLSGLAERRRGFLLLLCKIVRRLACWRLAALTAFFIPAGKGAGLAEGAAGWRQGGSAWLARVY